MHDASSEAVAVARAAVRRRAPVQRMRDALELADGDRGVDLGRHPVDAHRIAGGRQDRPFSEAEFSRREATDVFGVPLAIASLEDVIRSKLEWARLVASGRQLDDVRTLLRIAGDAVDRSYLERWVAALGVRAEWQAVQE